MEVHVLEANQRRMLLEMLASERAGEASLLVGDRFGRGATAEQLCQLRLSAWIDRAHVGFTELGRRLAENLAERLTGAPLASAC